MAMKKALFGAVVIFGLTAGQADAATILEFLGDGTTSDGWYSGGLNSELLFFQTFTVPLGDSELTDFSLLAQPTSFGSTNGFFVNAELQAWDDAAKQPVGNQIWTASTEVTPGEPTVPNAGWPDRLKLANFSPKADLVGGSMYVLLFTGTNWNGLIQDTTPYAGGTAGYVVRVSNPWDDYSGAFDLPMTMTFSDGSVAPVPIPAALLLLASSLGALGFIGWRRKRKEKLAAA